MTVREDQIIRELSHYIAKHPEEQMIGIRDVWTHPGPEGTFLVD
ncbi:hypothetical protein [Streptomyces malaysiensis]|nr:hypothetical protein [Streptomyces malaysiensis]